MAALARKATSAWKATDKMSMNSGDLPNMFLPPVNRSMRVLDRSFFRKIVPLSAATVLEPKNISSVRGKLKDSGDLLSVFPITPIRDDDSQPNQKCILLKPEIRANEKATWTPTISSLVEQDMAQIRPYDLKLGYNDWTMHNILEAVLPEFPEEEKETPAGFAAVGHVAHVNLRDPYLPYKHLIGQLIVDKNPQITTVINKIEDVGAESIFRTFPYEVIAGPNDLDVETSASGCTFRFNFGKVYWNTRLNTEHKRIIDKFREGDTVCDVMAGVGPFAVPAGKKRVFVWANDLNPDSYAGLADAIKRNKVDQFVTPSCLDGRDFIRQATRELPLRRRRAEVEKAKRKPLPRDRSKRASKEQALLRAQDNTITIEEPSTFNHYVMNLPATAVEFLDAFKGVYVGRKRDFLPYTMRFLPMIHFYMFVRRGETEREEHEEACRKVTEHLGHVITPETEDVELFDVRLVSPKKKMYCASFRLPAEVAFAESAG